MFKIEFNYAKAMRQAGNLEESANRLKQLAQASMSDTLQQLNANWTGENATAYIQKGRTLQQQISETAAELTRIAENIRTVARRMRDAEQRARDIAGHGG